RRRAADTTRACAAMPSTSKPPRLIARPLPLGERAGLSRALAKAGLPIDDLEEAGRLFWRFETLDQVPVGFGGLEVHGRDALLRSLLTLPPAQKRGIGSAMVALLEIEAVTLRCRTAWLITTTAAGFFERLGYESCRREQVPATIRNTRQFSSLCPDSAAVLMKRLR
ncbi:MAG TPA: arsenic resistance N-acetyltransferase ArsN2, partial [Xanthobacteraceae bacterium]|nr:arsenic resistance N-acetyltransferase ArsN2 [Xanthobacteraceae bacterium]